MKKYFLKSGEELHIGDTVCISNHLKHPFGYYKQSTVITITEEVLKDLIKDGDVIEVEPKVSNVSPFVGCNFNIDNKIDREEVIDQEFSYLIDRVAKKLNKDTVPTIDFLVDLEKVNPTAAFGLLLKEMAIKLDFKYEDHISKSPKLYGVSLLDGKISEINKSWITSYKTFAAFRTKEDAEFACEVLGRLYNKLFNVKK